MGFIVLAEANCIPGVKVVTMRHAHPWHAQLEGQQERRV